jgi:hypothetical protein
LEETTETSGLDRFTRLAYCQYLLSSQVNYTLTNLAEHLKSFNLDTINRYLKSEKLSPRLLWEQARSLVEIYPETYIIFEGIVLDKRFGPKIEGMRKQCSGRSVGVISCVYVNPKTEHFLWVVRFVKIDGARLRRIRRERAIQTRSIAHDWEGSARTS